MRTPFWLEHEHFWLFCALPLNLKPVFLCCKVYSHPLRSANRIYLCCSELSSLSSVPHPEISIPSTVNPPTWQCSPPPHIYGKCLRTPYQCWTTLKCHKQIFAQSCHATLRLKQCCQLLTKIRTTPSTTVSSGWEITQKIIETRQQ